MRERERELKLRTVYDTVTSSNNSFYNFQVWGSENLRSQAWWYTPVTPSPILSHYWIEGKGSVGRTSEVKGI